MALDPPVQAALELSDDPVNAVSVRPIEGI